MLSLAYIDRVDIDGGLLIAIEEIPKKIIRRNTGMASEIKSMRRKDIPEYPVSAVHEALLNALMHSDVRRDWARI